MSRNSLTVTPMASIIPASVLGLSPISDLKIGDKSVKDMHRLDSCVNQAQGSETADFHDSAAA